MMKGFLFRSFSHPAAVALSVVWLAPVVLGAPLVPGFERDTRQGLEADTARGELLLGELNCLSCHDADQAVHLRIPTKTAPDLAEVGSRVTPEYLKAFLNDPHGTKPGTTMPDILHASAPQSKAGAIDFLVHYLVSKGGPIAASEKGGTAGLVEQGRDLFHTVGCVACHAPEKADGVTTPVVPLPNLAAKTTVDQLTAFLLDPVKVRQAGRMPSLWLTDQEAHAIAVYLLRAQMEQPVSGAAASKSVKGVKWELFLGGMGNKLPDLQDRQPDSQGNAPDIGLDLPNVNLPKENFALRFTATLRVPRPGNYKFFLSSDDGSRLRIDNQVVIDNDGIHPNNEKNGSIQLKAGQHEMEVLYFERAGEEALGLAWSGPQIRKKQSIPTNLLSARDAATPMAPLGHQPFKVDPGKVRMGAQMFSALRCVSCHQMGEMRAMRPAPPLAILSLNNPAGCLGDQIRAGAPNYRLSEKQLTALRAALQDRRRLAQPLGPRQTVDRSLAALNCRACHKRDGFGGPDDVRSAHFKTTFTLDLGEEGTRPPTLNQVGFKLKADALGRLLEKGELQVRHYMATRMPGFGEANVIGLINNLPVVDRPGELPAEPKFSEAAMAVGHRLAGMNGMVCITCHNVAGNPGLGIQGIDLTTAYERVTHAWFRQFLLNPMQFNAGTRMPAFWPDGQSPFPDVLGGNATNQIDALWAYLSLGKTMPLPAGIVQAGTVGMELVPDNAPIVHRTFMKDLTPRSILVGFPAKLHVAFDANQVRLAKTWKGRFFDASGVASGRTDTFLGPLGEDPLDLPEGPAFASLDSLTAPWPQAELTERNVGGQFLGYRLDAEKQPIFRYRQNGVVIEEQPVPVLQAGGAALQRRISLQAGQQAPESFYFLAAEGKRIDRQSDTHWVIDGDRHLHLKLANGMKPEVRDSRGRVELLVPVRFEQGRAQLETLLQW